MSLITEGKPAGVALEVRIPPKLLARLDRIIARRAEPKPTHGKLIKNLVRQALNARERKGAAKSASRRA
jgi:hypothetical protein